MREKMAEEGWIKTLAMANRMDRVVVKDLVRMVG